MNKTEFFNNTELRILSVEETEVTLIDINIHDNEFTSTLDN